MAFGAGKEANQVVEVKKFIGLGTFTVVAINPVTEADFKAIYGDGYTLKNPPVYTGKHKDSGKDTMRVQFFLKGSKEDNPLLENDMITSVSYFLEKDYRKTTNTAEEKWAVINQFGQTNWATAEQAKNKLMIPNCEFFGNDYRGCYNGEEDLTKFIIAFLAIAGKQQKDSDGNWEDIPNITDAYARFEEKEILKLIGGDISGLRKIIASRKDNKVKFAVGVKTTEKGEYQDLFSRMPLKLKNKSTVKLAATIAEVKGTGGYANTQFSVEKLEVYQGTQATSFAPTASSTPSAGVPALPAAPIDFGAGEDGDDLPF